MGRVVPAGDADKVVRRAGITGRPTTSTSRAGQVSRLMIIPELVLDPEP
jgi:hypothetical protein